MRNEIELRGIVGPLGTGFREHYGVGPLVQIVNGLWMTPDGTPLKKTYKGNWRRLKPDLKTGSVKATVGGKKSTFPLFDIYAKMFVPNPAKMRYVERVVTDEQSLHPDQFFWTNYKRADQKQALKRRAKKMEDEPWTHRRLRHFYGEGVVITLRSRV